MEDLPEELKCPLCAHLVEDAVMLPCCAVTVCDPCVKEALDQVANHCPVVGCGSDETTADDLIPNRRIRTKSADFRAKHKIPVRERKKSEPEPEVEPETESPVPVDSALKTLLKIIPSQDLLAPQAKAASDQPAAKADSSTANITTPLNFDPIDRISPVPSSDDEAPPKASTPPPVDDTPVASTQEIENEKSSDKPELTVKEPAKLEEEKKENDPQTKDKKEPEGNMIESLVSTHNVQIPSEIFDQAVHDPLAAFNKLMRAKDKEKGIIDAEGHYGKVPTNDSYGKDAAFDANYSHDLAYFRGQPRGYFKPGMTCFTCHREGHRSADCPLNINMRPNFRRERPPNSSHYHYYPPPSSDPRHRERLAYEERLRRSRSGSPGRLSRERSVKRSQSREPSPIKEKILKRSPSPVVKKERKRSRSRSPEKKRKKERKRSRSRSRERSRRSRSRERSRRKRSRSKEKKSKKDRSRSREKKSKRKSRSRSRSPAKKSKKKDRSRSRSRKEKKETSKSDSEKEQVVHSSQPDPVKEGSSDKASEKSKESLPPAVESPKDLPDSTTAVSREGSTSNVEEDKDSNENSKAENEKTAVVDSKVPSEPCDKSPSTSTRRNSGDSSPSPPPTSRRSQSVGSSSSKDDDEKSRMERKRLRDMSPRTRRRERLLEQEREKEEWKQKANEELKRRLAAEEAKEKADLEAKAAKERAEQDAKAAQEKADLEAKIAREKAEEEKRRRAKEQAEREAQQKAELEAHLASEKAEIEAKLAAVAEAVKDKEEDGAAVFEAPRARKDRENEPEAFSPAVTNKAPGKIAIKIKSSELFEKAKDTAEEKQSDPSLGDVKTETQSSAPAISLKSFASASQDSAAQPAPLTIKSFAAVPAFVPPPPAPAPDPVPLPSSKWDDERPASEEAVPKIGLVNDYSSADERASEYNPEKVTTDTDDNKAVDDASEKEVVVKPKPDAEVFREKVKEKAELIKAQGSSTSEIPRQNDFFTAEKQKARKKFEEDLKRTRASSASESDSGKKRSATPKSEVVKADKSRDTGKRRSSEDRRKKSKTPEKRSSPRDSRSSRRSRSKDRSHHSDYDRVRERERERVREREREQERERERIVREKQIQRELREREWEKERKRRLEESRSKTSSSRRSRSRSRDRANRAARSRSRERRGRAEKSPDKSQRKPEVKPTVKDTENLEELKKLQAEERIVKKEIELAKKKKKLKEKKKKFKKKKKKVATSDEDSSGPDSSDSDESSSSGDSSDSSSEDSSSDEDRKKKKKKRKKRSSVSGKKKKSKKKKKKTKKAKKIKDAKTNVVIMDKDGNPFTIKVDRETLEDKDLLAKLIAKKTEEANSSKGVDKAEKKSRKRSVTLCPSKEEDSKFPAVPESNLRKVKVKEDGKSDSDNSVPPAPSLDLKINILNNCAVSDSGDGGGKNKAKRSVSIESAKISKRSSSERASSKEKAIVGITKSSSSSSVDRLKSESPETERSIRMKSEERRSKSKTPEKAKKRSRSPTPEKSKKRSRSPTPEKVEKKSRSPTPNKSKKISRSPTPEKSRKSKSSSPSESASRVSKSPPATDKEKKSASRKSSSDFEESYQSSLGQPASKMSPIVESDEDGEVEGEEREYLKAKRFKKSSAKD